MNDFFKGLFILLGVVFAVGVFGFCVWTEAKHDKSAYKYIKDQIETKEDKPVTDEVTTESEDGTVEATATIKF